MTTYAQSYGIKYFCQMQMIFKHLIHKWNSDRNYPTGSEYIWN